MCELNSKITVMMALFTALSFANLNAARAAEPGHTPTDTVGEDTATTEAVEFRPFEFGFGVGPTWFFGDFEPFGPALQYKGVWGLDSENFISVQGQYIETLCHRSGDPCPEYADVALSYGKTLRSRWAHISGSAGLAVGRATDYRYNDDAGKYNDATTDWTVGAAASFEAYFTPIPWVGIGIEVPATVNTRIARMGVLLGFKIGNLAPQ